MIFPWNVDEGNKSIGKSSPMEKVQFGIALFALCNVMLAMFVSSVLSTLRIPIWVGIVGQFIILVILFIFVIRFVVLKEDEKLKEYNSGESFLRYYRFRKDAEEELHSHDRTIPVFEYDNGTCIFVMEFKYGSNDARKEKNTKEVLGEILRIVASNRLEIRTMVIPEDFLAGNEARRMMEVAAKAKGTKVGKFNLRLVDGVLEGTKSSNLESLFITVKTSVLYQRYELDTVLNAILSAILSNRTCFREVNFLDKVGLTSLMKSFYGVEAIDLSMVSVVESNSDTMTLYNEMVSLYQINSVEGKSFTKPMQEKKTSAIKL